MQSDESKILNMLAQKSQLRKIMKNVIKSLTSEEKQRQSNAITNYLLNDCDIFAKSKHICLYLAMKHEEIDTIPLIERILISKDKENSNKIDFKLRDKHIYIPHVEMSISKENDKMCFFELKDMNQFKTEMNDNNKYKILQFNEPDKMMKCDEKMFDLIIVPGLAFELNEKNSINRLGRGKGYFDIFLSKVRPDCYKLGIGFNQQYLTINKDLIDQNLHVPVNEGQDVCINDFVCEYKINKI
jgi:5-formyltetrahydrofolate cyclo-ligase